VVVRTNSSGAMGLRTNSRSASPIRRTPSGRAVSQAPGPGPQNVASPYPTIPMLPPINQQQQRGITQAAMMGGDMSNRSPRQISGRVMYVSPKAAARKDTSKDGFGEEVEQPEEEEGPESNEMTEEELRALRKRCLRFFDVLILLCAAALCGGSLYVANSVLIDNAGPMLASVAAGISGVLFAVNIFGLLSVWSNNVRNKVLLTVSMQLREGVDRRHSVLAFI
jgi:hypothetical protein